MPAGALTVLAVDVRAGTVPLALRVSILALPLVHEHCWTSNAGGMPSWDEAAGAGALSLGSPGASPPPIPLRVGGQGVLDTHRPGIRQGDAGLRQGACGARSGEAATRGSRAIGTGHPWVVVGRGVLNGGPLLLSSR